MKLKIFVVLFLSTAAFFSCRRALITPDEVGNEPVRNFELFWNDVDKTYPFFTEDNVDWQAIHDKYRPLVKENTSTVTLFNILSNMLAPLMDGHRSITYNGESRGPGFAYDENDRYRFSFIKQKYLLEVNVSTQPDEFDNSRLDTVLITGKTLDSKYAYLGVRSYATKLELENVAKSYLASFNNLQGIIIDLRSNKGGYVYQMFNFMSLFAKYDVPYATYQPRIGPLKDHLFPLDLLSEPDFVIKSIKSPFAYKKIVFITNRVCFSAAEHSAMAAKQMGYPIVGDTTGGALSLVVEKTLPNGIQYTLVNSKILDINNKLWERIGFPPTVPVKASKQDFNTTDPYLDRAIIELDRR